jgi:hypothetical protein
MLDTAFSRVHAQCYAWRESLRVMRIMETPITMNQEHSHPYELRGNLQWLIIFHLFSPASFSLPTPPFSSCLTNATALEVVSCTRGSASTRPMQLSLDMSAIHCSFLFPEHESKPNKDAQIGTWVAHVAHMLQGLSACEAALEEKGRW